MWFPFLIGSKPVLYREVGGISSWKVNLVIVQIQVKKSTRMKFLEYSNFIQDYYKYDWNALRNLINKINFQVLSRIEIIIIWLNTYLYTFPKLIKPIHRHRSPYMVRNHEKVLALASGKLRHVNVPRILSLVLAVVELQNKKK